MTISLQHPLREWLSLSANPADTASVLGSVLPLRRLEPLGPISDWWHLDGHRQIGSLPLAASLGSPLLVETGEHPQHWLLLLHDGLASIHQGRQRYELQAGDALILPGLAWTLLTQDSSCSVLAFDAMELLAAARRVGGPRWQAPSPRHNPLRCSRLLRAAEECPQSVLLSSLSRLLPVFYGLAPLGETLIEALMLQQQLLRLLALLVFPELGNDDAEASATPATPADARLESLLDFISLNLAQSITLQMLEERSNYSRRSLHYLFQQRFGCSPMQWVRQLRMALAEERLTHPTAGDTVKAVAAECGYRSLSQFSLDFQRAHGRRPSDVLRAGRGA
ncbi:MAG: helix-turn-helix domain-containing protein [Synechococcaceae cyanobacterium]